MAKIVVAKLNARKGSDAKGVSVSRKRVRGADGELTLLRTLDAGSDSFGQDLQYVFGRNVAKARRDNKEMAGMHDVAIPKR